MCCIQITPALEIQTSQRIPLIRVVPLLAQSELLLKIEPAQINLSAIGK
jgi:hypothetical protein